MENRYMRLLYGFFIKGKIPYLMVLKKILLWAAIVLPFSIFLVPGSFRDFAEIGWIALVGVLLVRPVADILPNLRIFRTLISFRKEFGIFSALMFFAHFSGFLIINKISLISIFGNKLYWSYDKIFFWGLLALIVAIPVILSSNSFIKDRLKSLWRHVQRLSYLLFIFGGVHIYMVGEESGIIGVTLVAVFWILAKLKLQIKIPRPTSP